MNPNVNKDHCIVFPKDGCVDFLIIHNKYNIKNGKSIIVLLFISKHFILMKRIQYGQNIFNQTTLDVYNGVTQKASLIS